MVGIVEPDGDEVADPADAGAEPGLAADQRQLVDRRLADLGEPLGRQRLPGDIGHHLREVADAPFGVDDSGLFATVRAEADELHGALSPRCSGKVIRRQGAGSCVGRPRRASKAEADERGHFRADHWRKCVTERVSELPDCCLPATLQRIPLRIRPVTWFLRLQSDASADTITSCTWLVRRAASDAGSGGDTKAGPFLGASPGQIDPLGGATRPAQAGLVRVWATALTSRRETHRHR